MTEHYATAWGPMHAVFDYYQSTSHNVPIHHFVLKYTAKIVKLLKYILPNDTHRNWRHILYLMYGQMKDKVCEMNNNITFLEQFFFITCTYSLACTLLMFMSQISSSFIYKAKDKVRWACTQILRGLFVHLNSMFIAYIYIYIHVHVQKLKILVMMMASNPSHARCWSVLLSYRGCRHVNI